MKRRVFIIVLVYYIISGFIIESQSNYIQYHRSFATVEELIVNEDFKKAESKLNDLFEKYKVRFAKDYVIAAQVSLVNEHRQKALQWMREAMRMGVKMKCLESIQLFKERITEKEWEMLRREISELRKVYLKKLNLEWYQEFHRRYQEEQTTKRTDRYKTVVSANFQRIKQIMETGNFIGERFIGIDNQKLARGLKDCDCGNSRVIVTLLHYDYPISELGEQQLIQEIEKGNLHPREFATIYNFERNQVSVLYKKSDKKYKELTEYQFNFSFGEIHEDIEKVNSDRQQFGICKYEVDKKKTMISQKYGLKLRFGYR